MPQLFQVLRCYKCGVFQVHQCKKSNKWECKLCGEKQSIKRHYGLGTGQECRSQVQKLNLMRCEMDNTKQSPHSSDDNTIIEENELKPLILKNSKWSEYIEVIDNESEISDEKMFIENREVVLEVPKKKMKRNSDQIVCDSKTPLNVLKDISTGDDLYSHPSFINSDKNINQIQTKSSKLISKQVLTDSAKENTRSLVNILPQPQVKKSSKWTQFVEKKDSDCQSNDTQINDEFFKIRHSEISKQINDLKPKEKCNNNEHIGLKQQEKSCYYNSSGHKVSQNINHNESFKQNTIFSLCADTDIDSVLDI